MAILYLNLKGEYFDAIKSGEKKCEFRLYNDYWRKRLYVDCNRGLPKIPKEFDHIIIRRGYPKKGDKKNEIKRPWKGFNVRPIKHEHFGSKLVWVFAIRVNN